jgi:hypothetical protein
LYLAPGTIGFGFDIYFLCVCKNVIMPHTMA